MLVLLGLFVALGVCLAGAFRYGAPAALLVIAGATLAGSMAKLGLDAVIQRDVPEEVRTSAFARSETALQLAWVGGGALGLVPWAGWTAMVVGAVFITLGLVFGFAELRHEGPRPRRNRPPRRPPPRSPDPPPGPPTDR